MKARRSGRIFAAAILAVVAMVAVDSLWLSPANANAPAAREANTPPTIAADPAATTKYLAASPSGPANISGVIGDLADPAATFGIGFNVADAETPSGELKISAASSKPSVVPNTAENLVISGSGASRNLRVIPAGVGYATITVTVTDAGGATASYKINYAASAGNAGRASTRYHTGTSDASAAVAVDAHYMFIGDDENQLLRLYFRRTSGLPVYSFDPGPYLKLTDPKHPEVDIEAAARVGDRIYWLGSHSNSANAGHLRVNRYRLFATDISGTGAAARLTYVGRYDKLRADLIKWDLKNGHGLGANRYGLAAGSDDGVVPEASDGSGFNIEGLTMAPDNTTAYVAFRAPIVPASSRSRALIVPVMNIASLVSGNPSQGPATFGKPIELDLGGGGIRDIARNARGQYVIIAGAHDDKGNFRLFTWSGDPADAPVLRSADLTGLHPEGIVEVPDPLTAESRIQLVSDDGDTLWYNDGILAKELTQPNFKKFRSDIVTLGDVVR